MNDWFTIERIDEDTYSISEYCHWEETHAYLLSGTEYSLIIDTGLGIMNIYEEVTKLTDSRNLHRIKSIRKRFYLFYRLRYAFC